MGLDEQRRVPLLLRSAASVAILTTTPPLLFLLHRMFQALERNSTLLVLDLARNGVSDGVGVLLARAAFGNKARRQPLRIVYSGTQDKLDETADSEEDAVEEMVEEGHAATVEEAAAAGAISDEAPALASAKADEVEKKEMEETGFGVTVNTVAETVMAVAATMAVHNVNADKSASDDASLNDLDAEFMREFELDMASDAPGTDAAPTACVTVRPAPSSARIAQAEFDADFDEGHGDADDEFEKEFGSTPVPPAAAAIDAFEDEFGDDFEDKFSVSLPSMPTVPVAASAAPPALPDAVSDEWDEL